MNVRHFLILLVVSLLSTGAWLPASAQDYCLNATRFDAQQVEIRKWKNALLDRRFVDLEAHFSGLIRGYEKSELDDDTVERWFRVFSQTSPALEPLHREWMKKYPASFAAHLAAAEYFHTVGHAKRGGKFARDTSESQFEAMRASYDEALAILDRAEKLTSKPTLAIALRIYLMRATGGRDDVLALFRRGEKVDPGNLRVKVAYISSLNPKWGGSIEELGELLKAMQAGSLPRSKKSFVEYLVTYEVADDVLHDKRTADAIKLYERANQLCPAVEEILVTLVRLYDDEKRYTEMRGAADRYIARRSDSGWGYARRAWANYYLSNLQSSMADAEKAAALDDNYGTYLLGWFYDKGKAVVARDAKKALELYTTAKSRGYAKAEPDVERLRAELRK